MTESTNVSSRREGVLSRRDLLGATALAAAVTVGGGTASAAPGNQRSPAPAMHQDGVTVVMVGETDLETLRVDTWGSLLAYQAYRALYEPLVHFNTKEDESGGLYYDPESFDFRSAESVEVLDDGLTLKWKIRAGQTFENGKPIDANAWAKTFQWHFDRKGVGYAQAQNNGTLFERDAVYAESDDVLVMKFPKPTPWQVSSFYILNQSVVDVDEIMSHATDTDPFGEAWTESNTVASGPYRLERWDRGEQLVFTARDDYWGGKPQIDRLIMRIVPDASVRYQLISRGEVDIASGITFKDLAALKDNEDVAFDIWRTNDWREFVLSWQTEPLNDVNVRKAIASAIPYDTIMSQVFYGIGERVKSPFGLLVPGADDSLWPYDYDLEKARAFLAQSSVPDGFTMPFYVATTNPMEEPVALLLQDSLGQIGIELDIQKMTGVQLSEALINQKIEMAQFSFYSWVDDPGYHILWNFLPQSFANFANFQNPEVQDVAQQIIDTAPGAERDALVTEFQKQFAEQVVSLPFVSLPEVYPHKKNLSGFAYYPDSCIRWDKITVGE